MSEASSSPNDLPSVPGLDRPLSDIARTTSTDQHDKTFIGAEPAPEGGGIQVSVGQKIGKYEIRKRLGEGGMGAVYLGFDPMIEREVALKVLTPEVANSPTALQRFLGEARAIGRLNHPHVVSIFEIDQWQGQYYLVMELLSGGSVAQLSEEQGALSWQEACRITAEAARGMEAAHAVGMIHRDIKPENLMLTRDRAVKVVDFGLSKLLDAANDPQKAVTKAGQILGTPQYMSPEQFEGQDLDMRTDIYSLGATFFRLLTSRYPYHDCRISGPKYSMHCPVRLRPRDTSRIRRTGLREILSCSQG
jgi:serine/threonine protein kinase